MTETEASALKSFDRVADVYDETRGLPAQVAADVADGLATIMRRIAESPRLVEVGIGTGRMAVPLAERGVRVTGLDVSSAMLAKLRAKRRDIDVMLAEASRPPLRDASFDAALFAHILHLVPDAAATIRATLPLVRAGGVVIEARDDYRQTIREEAEQLIQRVVSEVTGLALDARGGAYQRSAELVEEILLDHGARIEQRTLAAWESTTTGSRMLERLRRKDFSSSWRIPNDALPAIIDVVTPKMEALLGGLDREVPFTRSFSVTAGWLPA